jgi:release factor glutamine methyltransferase
MSTETWTVLKILAWTRDYLAGKGVENARLESEWLLSDALGLDRVGLYLNFDRPLNSAELARYRGMVSRRAKREPLQHILGSQEFMGLEFEVSPAALIPRHDTETVVEEVIRRCTGGERILDIGLGSGCIAVALAKKLPQVSVYGVEKTASALELASRNAAKHGVTLEIAKGSLFEPFEGLMFDIVVSNPPYIPTGEIPSLQPEVRDFEPVEALDGGPDGLDFYRMIIPSASKHMSPGGWLIFEVGAGQSDSVKEIFAASTSFADIFSAKDPAGIERVVGGRLKKGPSI